MANMSMCMGDNDMLTWAVTALLNRRRQLCPWPFDVTQTELLYIPKNIHDLKPHLMEVEGLCAITNSISLDTGYKVNNQNVQLHIKHKESHLWGGAGWNAKNKLVPSSSSQAEFLTWLRNAIQVQSMNEVTHAAALSTIRACTTYKQLQKALPQSMKAIRAHVDSVSSRSNYQHTRAIEKFKEVMVEIGDTGGGRAKVMPPELTAVLDKYKATIEGTLASAVLLPAYEGLDQNSAFTNTWFNRSFNLEEKMNV